MPCENTRWPASSTQVTSLQTFFFFKEDSLYLGNQVKYINEEEPFILSHDESNSHCRLCPEAVRLLDLTVKGLYSELAYFTPMLLSGCPHCKVP